jgi:hypothetical protein
VAVLGRRIEELIDDKRIAEQARGELLALRNSGRAPALEELRALAQRIRRKSDTGFSSKVWADQARTEAWLAACAHAQAVETNPAPTAISRLLDRAVATTDRWVAALA